MFERSLITSLEKIFKLGKVTFDRPGESQEQEGVFIEVIQAVCRKKDAKQTARVTGTLHFFANQDKMPFGYLTKCISEADPALTKPLVFLDFEESKGKFRNIVERSVGFQYFFDSQYDPAIGTVTSINLSYQEP